MSIMKCPHCGREYSARACRPLIPTHRFVVKNPSQMSAAALEAGAVEEDIQCPGSGQGPRNALSDKRPLWSEEDAKAHGSGKTKV